MGTSGIWIHTFIGGKPRTDQTKIAVVIDGMTHPIPPGEPFLPVHPGVHTVSARWTTSVRAKAPPAIEVQVPDDGSVVVRFDAPRWIWQSSRLSASLPGPEPRFLVPLDVGSNLGSTHDASALYTGPTPSPARSWAPWVIVT